MNIELSSRMLKAFVGTQDIYAPASCGTARFMGRHTREQRDEYSRLRKEVRTSTPTSQTKTTPNRASQSGGDMAPSGAIIDLTGEDDGPSERTRAQVPRGSQSNSQHDSKPANGNSQSARGRPATSTSTQRSSGVAQDNTSAPTKNAHHRRSVNGHSQSPAAVQDITSAPSRNADVRRSLNGHSQSSYRFDTPNSQSSQSRRGPANGSNLPGSRDRRPEKRMPDVDLTEDDEENVSDRPPPKQFKMPRGFDPTGFTPPSSQTGSAFSPNKTNGELRRKRPLESQSPRESPSNRVSPFKRQRLEKQDSDDRVASNSQSESRSGTKVPHETSTRSDRRSSPEHLSPGKGETPSRNSLAQTKTRQTHRDTGIDATPTTARKSGPSPAVTAVTGSQARSGSSTKFKDDNKRSSKLETPASVTSSTQSKRDREVFAKSSRSPSHLSSIPFRDQRSPSAVGSTSRSAGMSAGSAAEKSEREQSQTHDQQPEASIVTDASTKEPNGKTIRRLGRDQPDTRNGTQSSSKGGLQNPASQNALANSKDNDGSNTSESGGAVRRATSPGVSATPSADTPLKTPLQVYEDANAIMPETRKSSAKKSRTEQDSVEARVFPNEQISASATTPRSNPPNDADSGRGRSIQSNSFANSKAAVTASQTFNATGGGTSAANSKTPSSGAVTDPLVTEILGNLQFAITARGIIDRLDDDPDVNREMLMLLKSIFERYPSTRTDSAALSRYLSENLQRDASDTSTDVSTLPQKPSRTSFTEAEAADLQLQSEAMQDVVQQDQATEAPKTFVPPTVSASALRASSIFSTLPLASRVEKVLGRYLEELRGDSEYWTGVSMRRARLSKELDAIENLAESHTTPSEEATSFAHMKPLTFPIRKKNGSSTKSDEEVWHIQRMSTETKPQPHVDRSTTFVTFESELPDVPTYSHYVSIKNNILAPNVTHLHYWPYFSDDFDLHNATNLKEYFNIDIVDRERKLLLLLQAQKYDSYVESALQDLECSWADVLRFLLDPSPDVGSDLDARKAYQNRSQYCEQDFSRTSERWIAVLSSLPPSTPEKLGRVAVLCENFQRMAKFSLWHIAKRSDFAKLPEETKPTPTHPSDNELTCRICLRFNCPYHGQFQHHAEDSGSDHDDSVSMSSVDSVVAMDIVHPRKANYRSRIAFPADSPMRSTSDSEAPVKKRQKDPNYWMNNYKNKAEERGPFYPCNHPGTSCEDANCRCFARNIPCEKLCGCSTTCPRKFKGCSCGLRKGHRLVCFEDADCACFQLGRECDPDLCGSCGVCDVVDPVNKYNDNTLTGRCRNASIQRGVPKHTLLGDSVIHGLGLYACEPIKQNDFVGEYKGEIITKREADRRGAVYEHQKLSYLFSLNKAQEIDSTSFGNKVRFINHAHGDKANLYPRIIMVNTVHRIALYASKDIVAGKELLFDYGPLFPHDQLQGKKSKKSTQTESKKSAPHVRNANLVREFVDVEESEDEDGVLRTKAVSHRAAGTKGRANGRKPHGGARQNAGRRPQPGKVIGREAERRLVSDLEKAQNVEERRAAYDKAQNAQERLTAFNISDDPSSGYMDIDPNGIDEEDDEAFEPEGSESDDSEPSEESERSIDFDDEDEEELDQVRTSRRRAVANMRSRR